MEILLLCIKIFCVRILDVSLGTIRTIITVKGKNFLASSVGFFEMLVWFVIAREALSNDATSLWIAVAYSLGFATGTYIGGVLSERFIKGTFSVQIVTSRANDELIDKLRQNGYGVSVIDVKGKNEEKYLLFAEINKKELSNLKDIVKKIDNNAFIVVNEPRGVYNGYFK